MQKCGKQNELQLISNEQESPAVMTIHDAEHSLKFTVILYYSYFIVGDCSTPEPPLFGTVRKQS